MVVRRLRTSPVKLPLLAVLLAITLGACAQQHPKQSTTSHWPFSVHGQLAESDIGEIVAIVQSIPNLDHRIVRIEAKTPRNALVHTGEQRGPLDSGGHIVTLEKRNGRWIVTEDWRESIWVS